MTKKFVVLYEYSDCEGIFDVEGDAEEYILSLAEEVAYEDFLGAYHVLLEYLGA